MDISELTYEQLTAIKGGIEETITTRIKEMSSEEFLALCQDVEVINHRLETMEDIAITTWADARRENKFNQSL